MHAHQTPSSSTASALKPTVCGSAITFLVNRAFRSCDQWGARITLGNSSASLRMCRLKQEFLMNYTLCPCWSPNVNERQNLRHSQPRVVCGNCLGLWRLTLKNPYHLQTFLEGKENQYTKIKTESYVLSGLSNSISCRWERKSATGKFATGPFGRYLKDFFCR